MAPPGVDVAVALPDGVFVNVGTDVLVAVAVPGVVEAPGGVFVDVATGVRVPSPGVGVAVPASTVCVAPGVRLASSGVRVTAGVRVWSDTVRVAAGVRVVAPDVREGWGSAVDAPCVRSGSGPRPSALAGDPERALNARPAPATIKARPRAIRIVNARGEGMRSAFFRTRQRDTTAVR